ncbi:MAG: NADH-quinone oxidoreductase subunit L [Acidobacteriota bacterium]
MDFLAENSHWILLISPLAGFLFNGILGKRFSTRLVAFVACAAVGLSFLASLLIFLKLIQFPAEERFFTREFFTWIESGKFAADFTFLFDPLSTLMILIVTGVGFLIHVYSVEYMAEEPEGYYRYFAYLNLFIFMMTVLVLANNYLLMFVGWEGVGLCSYLLIGYYFQRKSAGAAAKKAFIVNRIGDVGFILGVFLIFRTFGSLEYLTVFSEVAERFTPPEAGWGILAAIALLLFLGAAGKSAQIPLYVWLPDAMEGPTPVSALIHAATMVTAGVYMIARSAAIYSRAADALIIVAVIGILTALLAALIALTQSDIKRVLAYSTVSQLGYMFLALGVGAFGAGIFHLMTHAFFKALLFLGSGSVILAMHHEQNMFRMGGLKRHLPVTFWTMWIATAAIAGVPLLSGFFSKDEILWQTFSNGYPLLWAVGIAVAGLTAFYMVRLMLLTFHGKAHEPPASSPTDHHHAPREAGGLVKIPLILLAVFSIFAGYLGLPAYLGANRLEAFLEPSFQHKYEAEVLHADGPHGHATSTEIILTFAALLVVLVGIFLAWKAYVQNRDLPRRLAARFSGLYHVLLNKFYVDELYDKTLVHPTRDGARSVLWRAVDVNVIDRIVNGTASTMQSWSDIVRRIQSGYVRSYASWILGGAVLIFLYYFLASF